MTQMWVLLSMKYFFNKMTLAGLLDWVFFFVCLAFRRCLCVRAHRSTLLLPKMSKRKTPDSSNDQPGFDPEKLPKDRPVRVYADGMLSSPYLNRNFRLFSLWARKSFRTSQEIVSRCRFGRRWYISFVDCSLLRRTHSCNQGQNCDD